MGCEPPPHVPGLRPYDPIIETVDPDPEFAAKILSAVGLADAFTWARTPDELSTGQRARLDLALQIRHQKPVVVVDEWLAHLDRLTGRAVAWATGKALKKAGVGAILVTSHNDLEGDLCPDLSIQIGWEPEPEICWFDHHDRYCTILDELTYRRGDAGDWAKLRHLHYAAGDPATVHSYHVLEHPKITHPAAVAILSYPDLHSAARNLATDDAYRIGGSREAAQRLNREVLKLSRIVVAPELRGCGVAARLLTSLPEQVHVRYIECVTAMGRFSSFLSRVGFREIPQSTAIAEAKLLDFAVRHQVPPTACLNPEDLASWVAGLSVRVQREARRLIWLYYHHFVIHRRTRSAVPRRIPGPDAAGWPEAFDVVCRRINERPSYWILGPLDPMTGIVEIEANGAVEVA